MERLRQRWTGWWVRRHPRSDAILLDQHNIYIMPTVAGWMFGALLIVLLIASINFQLNLGYALTFMLASAALTSIHATHGVLRGLEAALHVGQAQPANQAAAITLRLRDATPDQSSQPAWRRRWLGAGLTRHGIGLRFLPLHGANAQKTRQPEDDDTVWANVPAGAEARVEMQFLPTQRGWHRLPDIVLETRFPFGLLRAWSYWRPATLVLAWPVAEANAPPLPDHAQHDAAQQPTRRVVAHAAEPDSSGLRPWRRGDTPQQIHWKKSAQTLAHGGDPVSRERQGAATQDRHIRWVDARETDHERRIARLTAWVREAHARGGRYALDLPGDAGTPQPVDTGPAHLHHCLHRLATWGLTPPEDHP